MKHEPDFRIIPENAAIQLRGAFRGPDDPGLVPTREEALCNALEMMIDNSIISASVARNMARLTYEEGMKTELVAKRLLDICNGVNYNSKPELYKIAQVLGIPGRSKMGKAALLMSIHENGEYVPAKMLEEAS